MEIKDHAWMSKDQVNFAFTKIVNVQHSINKKIQIIV